MADILLSELIVLQNHLLPARKTHLQIPYVCEHCICQTLGLWLVISKHQLQPSQHWLIVQLENQLQFNVGSTSLKIYLLLLGNQLNICKSWSMLKRFPSYSLSILAAVGYSAYGCVLIVQRHSITVISNIVVHRIQEFYTL